jgi:hypothetical protein
MKRTLICAAAIVVSATPAVGGSTNALAEQPDNAVVHWSRVSQQALLPAPTGARAQVQHGIVHVAIYDTMVAIDGGYQPFVTARPTSPKASAEAAIATAARDVLVARVPTQAAAVDAEYAAALDAVADGPAKVEGVALGRAVAADVLAWRADDGLDRTIPWVQPTPGPGVFEPVAAPGQTPGTPAGLELTQTRLLAIDDGERFVPQRPPRLSSRRYARDFAEVRALGRAESEERSTEQTTRARFWSENAFAQQSRNLANLAAVNGLDLLQSARLLAMSHVAAADSLMVCFTAKYRHAVWRPVHAIQRADTDGNRATHPDRTWQSLLVSNHPEYPGANGCVTAAIAGAVRTFFGTDHVEWTWDSAAPDLPAPTRTFRSMSQLVDEANDDRVWAGLHFRTSAEHGARAGTRVARSIARHHFLPATDDCRGANR